MCGDDVEKPDQWSCCSHHALDRGYAHVPAACALGCFDNGQGCVNFFKDGQGQNFLGVNLTGTFKEIE